MLVILPVAQSDISDNEFLSSSLVDIEQSSSSVSSKLFAFGKFLSSLRHFGDYKKHDLVVVCRKTDKDIGSFTLNMIKDMFSISELLVFEDEKLKTGWPLGPNSYWKRTIEHLKEIDNKQPWFWMESDITPLKPGWLDCLQAEYESYGCDDICMGALSETATVTQEGKRITLSHHLQGTAVYAARLDKISSTWKHVDSIPTAFDVLCQGELWFYIKETKLIQQGFRTINYKLWDKVLPFIKGEDNGDLQNHISYANPLDLEACVHHGCKDGSLSELVTTEEYAEYLTQLEKLKRA